jgi:hypothetical protein
MNVMSIRKTKQFDSIQAWISKRDWFYFEEFPFLCKMKHIASKFVQMNVTPYKKCTQHATLETKW